MTQTIAVLGASSDRAKYGNKCVRAYRQAGWTVYPVNPNEREIEGLAAYARLADVPGDLDRVSVYLPPRIGAAVVPEIAAKGAGQVWFNPGADAPEVLAAAREAGLDVHAACSIVAIGLSPSQFP